MKLLVCELEVWMQFYTTLNLLPQGCLSGKPKEVEERWQKAATGENLSEQLCPKESSLQYCLMQYKIEMMAIVILLKFFAKAC